MAGNVPFKTYNTSDFIKRFSNIALTAQYRAVINIQNLPFSKLYAPSNRYTEDLSILCSETSLPGSRFSTTENNQDYYGISQKFAYRKDFDTISMTFYVDTKYTILKFFEQWMDYIACPDLSYAVEGQNVANTNSFYRFKYPEGTGGYKTDFSVHKFNKDYEPVMVGGKPVAGTGNGADIIYKFVNAFPINISSMPVSYEASQLLKTTIAFSFDRYYVNRETTKPIQKSSTAEKQPEQSITLPKPPIGPTNTQATQGDSPLQQYNQTTDLKVNPDSSFQKNVITDEDRQAVKEELNMY